MDKEKNITEQQSESQSPETIVPAQEENPSSSPPAEISSNQIAEPMEVHHSSHVDHNKKWKDYLYEFVMLFLAVTAGFFVENQREHYIENRRAAQFSKQLLSDLRLDSILFEDRKRNLDARQKG